MTFKRVLQKAHRWLGLLLFIQVTLWMASGVVMSWFPIELVRGETTALDPYATELQPHALASPGGIIAQVDGATSVALQMMGTAPVYIVEGSDGLSVFDANTGAPRPALDERGARLAAQRDFLGEGDVVDASLLDNPLPEYLGPRPVWRVAFDDPDATRLYLSPVTGEVLARRNRIWRLYDFFWMLHIMDYDGRTDFNNPLLKAASATGLLFALSGAGLVLNRIASGRYRRDLRRDRPSEPS